MVLDFGFIILLSSFFIVLLGAEQYISLSCKNQINLFVSQYYYKYQGKPFEWIKSKQRYQSQLKFISLCTS